MNNIPEHILEQARQCNSKSDFREKFNYTFLLAKENNWLDTLFPPDDKLANSKPILTKEQCIEIAQQFTTIKDLNQAFPHVYNKIHKSKWANTCFNHMIRYSTYNWTLELCQAEASKYQTKKEFRQNNRPAYLVAYKNNWLDIICQHMIKTANSNRKWTLELCQAEASKYNNKKAFYDNNRYAYNAAHKYGWINSICQHMQPLGNKHKRCIYAYEFEDKTAYIGLTFNIKHRHEIRHWNKKDAVLKYINKSGLTPELKQLTDYLPVEEAQKLEAHYIQEYKNNNWTVLNKASAGALGGKKEIVYTQEQEQCIIELYNKGFGIGKIYKIVDFKSSRRSVRDVLVKYNINITKSNELIWTYDNCKAEAGKYTNKSDFYKLSHSAYQSAVNHGWYDVITSHFIDIDKIVINYNNYDLCKLEASKYRTRTDFSKNSKLAYKYSNQNNWLDDFFPITNETDRGFWKIKENCQVAASKCQNLKEFKDNYYLAFIYSKKNNWLVDFNLINNKILTFEKYKEFASSCTGRWDFNKKYGKKWANTASKNGWHDIVFPDGAKLPITFDRCKAAAADCHTRLEFQQKFPHLYNYSSKKKWLDELCQHLPKQSGRPLKNAL